MPILKSINVQNHSQIHIWEITESLDELLKGVVWYSQEEEKYSKISNPKKKAEFLALRQCLIHHFGTNPKVRYTANGKPTIANCFVSFSHSDSMAAVILSNTHKVGIDIEEHREQIKRIAPKFMSDREALSIDADNTIEHLFFYWGAKEVVVKIEGDKQILFRDEIFVEPFPYNEQASTTVKLRRNEQIKQYELCFQKFEKALISYGWSIETN